MLPATLLPELVGRTATMEAGMYPRLSTVAAARKLGRENKTEAGIEMRTRIRI